MKIFFSTILSLTIVLYGQNTGSISGRVIDKETHQPLHGVHITIPETNYGTATNKDGEYIISNIPVGSYIVFSSRIGYESISKSNVNIYSDRSTFLNFFLEQTVLQIEGVTITGGYFEKAKDAIVSSRTYDFEEIRSDPVGSFDIQKMMQALPAVVSEADQSNEIIVRGGGPGENLFIMDHLELPNPNHFGDIGEGGGPINIINTEFIDRIDFYAGGYPARYGDKQSSVMDVSLREGNTEKFDTEFEMSMAGVGVLAEGPIDGGNGSFLASIRQSFLKYIIKSTGLTAIPEYWNSQFKMTYDLNSRNKITVNGIGGADYVHLVDEEYPELRFANNAEHNGYQFTGGLTYKSLFSDRGYALLSLASSTSHWAGENYLKTNGEKKSIFLRKNTETDNYLKGDIVYKFSNYFTLTSGFQIKRGQYNMHEIGAEDTLYTFFYPPELADGATLDEYYSWLNDNQELKPTRYFSSLEDYQSWKEDFPEEANSEIVGVYISDSTLINPSLNHTSNGHLFKYAFHNQIKVQPVEKLTINVGLRFDKIPFNNTNAIAPRIGVSYQMQPNTELNFAWGKFYQTPFYWMLLNPKNLNYGGSLLRNSYTSQFVLGFERYFAQDIKGSLELYYKSYHNKPVYYSDLTEDIFDGRMGFVDIGEGRSSGLELFFQKKFSNKWYGTFSYSYSVSEGKDPRSWKDGYYSWDFDYGQVMTIIGGYKFNFREYEWYKNIRGQKILQFVSWLPFMISDVLEVSFRYRYTGGRPYTLMKYNHIYRRWYFDSDIEWNTSRYGYYSRLDIMILRRFNFKKINITTYLDLQNIFNRNNDWEYIYLPNGTKEMAYQYKQMPVGGIIIEF